MFAITGANGRVGHKTIDELIRRGVKPDRIVGCVRDFEKAKDLESMGVNLSRIEYNKKASLEQAFKGVDKVYYIPGLGTNEERTQQCRNAVDAAKAAGVDHYIAYSFADPDPRAPFLYNEYYAAKERHLEESGLNYSALRVPILADLTMINIMYAMKTGDFCLPMPTGKVALLSSNDIAASAAGVFLTPTLEAKKIYEITGPQALNLQDIVDIVNRVFSKSFKARAVSGEEWIKILQEMIGMSDYGARGSVSMWESADENRYAKLTNEVEDLTGRPAQSLEDLLEEQKENIFKMFQAPKSGKMPR